MNVAIYFAAPLFTIGEREFNVTLASRLSNLGHAVFLPQDHQKPSAKEIFRSDLDGLLKSAVVVAVIDGADPDSGTAWECGFAFAKHKPVILVKTDFRKIADFDREPCNIMISQCANGIIDVGQYALANSERATVTHVAQEIDNIIQSIYSTKRPADHEVSGQV